MIVPTAADMLKTVQTTLECVIRPDLGSTTTRSAAASVCHMLRIATLRIETEGQILHDERLRLNALLPQVADWLSSEGLTIPASIAARPRLAEDVYPSLAIMADEVGLLRQGVCDSLEILQDTTLDATGHQFLTDMLAHVAWQLEQEGKMIAPATVGHGPRR